MPSIDGGDSSGREYAPPMYMRGPDGDGRSDADYIFVHQSERKTGYPRDEGDIYWAIGMGAVEIVVNKVTYDAYWHRDVETYASIDDITPEAAATLLDRSLDYTGEVPYSVIAALALRLEPPVTISKEELFVEKSDIADAFSGDADKFDLWEARCDAESEKVAAARKKLGLDDSSE